MRAATLGGAVALVTALARALPAQASLPQGDSLRVVAQWDEARHQAHDAPLAFALSRPLRADEGRLAVLVGRADLSALLDVRGTRARLPLRGVPLPSGEAAVEAWLVAPGGAWTRVAQFALRRLTRAGVESLAVRPRLDVQSNGQVDAGRSRRAPPPARGDAFHDLSLAAGLEGALRHGDGALAWQGALAGASHETARLRAAQLGREAPMVDLASYHLRAGRGPMALTAGHLALGGHRLLAGGFRSRGVLAELAAGRRLQLQAGSVAGSELVGWRDPLGLARPAHRVIAGSAAMEAMPSRPGVLRVELTAMEGSLQPLPAFSQGAVTDREASRGVGVQVAAAHPSQRARLTMGVARSRFANPPDPALAGDSALVPVRPETRVARFAEAAVDVLRARAIGPVRAALSLGVRHERAEPLYRSVAAFVQADRTADALEASGMLGAAQWQASAARARDNLDEVPSLLRTRTQAQQLSGAVPVAALARVAPDAWWAPTLTAAWQGTTQRGDGAPPDGGFRFAFQVAHQRTSNLALGAAWERARWSIRYRHDRSAVDNRQPEREGADFAGRVHGLTLGATPSPRGSMALDVTRERLHSRETGNAATTRRAGLQGEWRPRTYTSLAGGMAIALTRDPLSTPRARNVESRLELSQGFNAWVRPSDGAQARAFVRWSRTSASVRLTSVPTSRIAEWALAAGMSVRLF